MVNHYLIGKRIRLIQMGIDPHPIPPMSEGTIYNVGYDVMNVKWDNGRSLGVVIGEDEYEILDEETIKI
jgi:hypothetical protein